MVYLKIEGGQTMAEVCACCGKILHGYFHVEIDKQMYKLCESCNIKMKKGQFSASDLPSSMNNSLGELVKKEEERIERKLSAQKNDPLYDDIHQIAKDLRFLKNYVIIGLVLSILSGILSIILPILAL